MDTTPILRRTLLADYSDGSLVFHDWAMVETTSGSMVEPVMCFHDAKALNTRAQKSDFVNRIDEIKIIDRAQRNAIINFGETINLHGEAMELTNL